MQSQKTRSLIGRVLVFSLASFLSSFVVFFLAFLWPGSAQAAPIKSPLQVKLDKNLGEVSFTALATHAIHIDGKGDGPSGTLQLKPQGANILINGSLAFLIDSLKTGISMRDRHMKEKYLETGKYSEARLTLKDFSTSADVLGEGDQSFAFTGMLFLHGLEKEVKGQINTHRNAGAASEVVIATNFKIKLTDFAVSVPSFAGITVADEVDIKVQFKVPGNAL